MASLYGKYIYGDWCTGDIWALNYSEDGNNVNESLIQSGINIASFGLNQNNEILICGNGYIYKLTSDEEPVMLGDLNQDNVIDILDIVLLLNLILGGYPSDYELWSADLNQDNVIDILDSKSFQDLEAPRIELPPLILRGKELPGMADD